MVAPQRVGRAVGEIVSGIVVLIQERFNHRGHREKREVTESAGWRFAPDRFFDVGCFGKAVAKPPHSKMGWRAVHCGRSAIGCGAGGARFALRFGNWRYFFWAELSVGRAMGSRVGLP